MGHTASDHTVFNDLMGSPIARMLGPIDCLDYLREIALKCLSGEPLDKDLSQWLGKALEDFLSRDCQSIEDGLGLKFPQGGIPWWREEANRKRDSALRELARRFFGDRSPCAKAREIQIIADRYAASAWRHDRNHDEMPERYAGTPHGLLWEAFKSGAIMPLGERQLRNIIAE